MASNPAPTLHNSTTQPSKGVSCVRCFERKVKCNKEHPCSACTRSKKECVFRTPTAARRRKKKTKEESLQARLTHYENLLKAHGLSPDDAPGPSEDSGHPEADAESEAACQDAETQEVETGRFQKPEGKLYTDHGKSTFLERLWSSLSNEVSHARDIIPESDDDDDDNNIPVDDPFRVDLVLGYTPTVLETTTLHPSPEHILKLWQIFLDNVNPLTKIIHQPTIQTQLQDALSNLSKIRRNFEPLMFAIYATAVTSTSETDCQRYFGEYRATLLAKYSLGMRQTLMKAKFLGTAELPILQAYVLYLFAMRPFYRARTVWVLAGVATRIGQGMGLHKDGSTLGLPIFETELRRRLWWQIAILDARSGELTGSAYSHNTFMDWLTKLPMNVNDSQLFPGMQELPEEHTKPTEMISCLVRYALGEFRRNQNKRHGRDWGVYGAPAGRSHNFAQADKMVDELEKHLEENFLRYLDPSIPVQFHASIVGRATIYTMRLMAHHPLHYNADQSDPSKLDPKERELLFTTSLKVIECDNLVHSTKSTQRFLWHVNVYFQWHPFIYLLSDLRVRPDGEQANRAWQQVEEIFEHHPDFISEGRRALNIAIGNLTLKAWTARERALTRQTGGHISAQTPQFIVLLRKQRTEAKGFRGSTLNSTFPSRIVAEHQEPALEGLPLIPATYQEQSSNQGFDTNMKFDPTLLVDTPMSGSEPIDWSQWDNLLQEFDIPT